MPFAEYDNFNDCVKKNADKKNPEAYCATIKRQIEQESATISQEVDNDGNIKDSTVSTEKLDVGDSVSTRAGDGKVLQVAGDSIMVQLSLNSDYPGQVFEYSRTDLHKESVSKEATAQRLSDPNLTFYTVENYVRQNGGKAVTNINLNKALNQILTRDKIVEKPTKQWYKKLIQIMNEEGYTNLWFDWPTANRTLFGK